jgi:hypothetical protein
MQSQGNNQEEKAPVSIANNASAGKMSSGLGYGEFRQLPRKFPMVVNCPSLSKVGKRTGA